MQYSATTLEKPQCRLIQCLLIIIALGFATCSHSAINSDLSLKLIEYSSAGKKFEAQPDSPGNIKSDLSLAFQTIIRDARFVYSSPSRLNTRTTIKTASLLAVGGLVFAFDQDILNAIQRNRHHPALEPLFDSGEFFEPVGYMGFTNKFYIATLAIGYITGYDPAVRLASDILESYAISGLLKNGANLLIGRRRPAMDYGPRSYKIADGTSFPSGHSLNAAQLAVITSHHADFLPYTIFAYGAAGSIMLQRIASDSHWPSDVYFGALFGFALSTTIMDLKTERRLNVIPIIDEKIIGLNLSYCLTKTPPSRKDI